MRWRGGGRGGGPEVERAGLRHEFQEGSRRLSLYEQAGKTTDGQEKTVVRSVTIVEGERRAAAGRQGGSSEVDVELLVDGRGGGLGGLGPGGRPRLGTPHRRSPQPEQRSSAIERAPVRPLSRPPSSSARSDVTTSCEQTSTLPLPCSPCAGWPCPKMALHPPLPAPSRPLPATGPRGGSRERSDQPNFGFSPCVRRPSPLVSSVVGRRRLACAQS